MTIKDPIIFLVGTAIGSGVTWFVTKKTIEKKAEEKYEALYQKEVESVKASFLHLNEKAKEKTAESEIHNEVHNEKLPSLDVYTDALKKARDKEEKVNYTNFTVEEEPEEDDEEDSIVDKTLIDETTDTSQPYILKRMPNPNEDPNYTQIEVTYYADGTYADSRDTEMEIEDYIGRKMMDYVENTEKDEVFIRNDELNIDVDIRKDTRTYDEVMFG